MKKGLLIHSYNCNEPNWEHTVWGHPPDMPGRLVTAMKVILEDKIDVALICGTAGTKDGKKECWWMKDRLYRGLEELKLFTIFPVFQEYTVDEMKEILDSVLMIREKDTGANTAGEAEYAGVFFTENGVDRVTLMSSPDHTSRCNRDVLACWKKNHPRLAANVYVTSSVTFYSERTPQDKAIADMKNVVIFEPPFYNLVGSRAQKVFGLRSNPEALAEIDAVLQKHGK